MIIDYFNLEPRFFVALDQHSRTERPWKVLIRKPKISFFRLNCACLAESHVPQSGSCDRAENDCASSLATQSAGKSRLTQQIPNVKSITERWRYFVDFLHDFESFYFPKRFIYLRGIAFSGPHRWNFRKARDFVYFIDPLLCIVASRAAFSRHGLFLTSR